MHSLLLTGFLQKLGPSRAIFHPQIFLKTHFFKTALLISRRIPRKNELTGFLKAPQYAQYWQRGAA